MFCCCCLFVCLFVCLFHWIILTLVDFLILLGDLSRTKSKNLHCGLLGQPNLFLCPGNKTIMICGGTLEKYGIFGEGSLPTQKCDLPKCLLEMDSTAGEQCGFSENPNYLGCQGSCKRWFHAYCLGLDYQKYLIFAQRDYWQCNRFDCIKKKKK